MLKSARRLGFCPRGVRRAMTGLTALGLALSALMSQAAHANTAPGLTPEMKATADRLIDTALEDDLAYRIVESLTTKVGPRLAGTPEEARAREWAMAMLKEQGFQNVRAEPFRVHLWTRQSDAAEIVSPYPQPLIVTALGNSVSTPEGGVEAEVVRFETLEDLIDAPLTGFEGRIVFVDEVMTRTMTGAGYGTAVRKRSQAAIEAGRRRALAALIRSVATHDQRFANTGGMRYEPGVPAVPIGALTPPDADQVARALRRGPVTVRLDLQVSGGGRTGGAWEGLPSQMADSANVVGEIPGRTDEIVLVGAHLDSWDLGTGALDDGAGVGIVTAAAKLVGDLRGRPRRTIRVVLFGSEEVGLVGARAYAQMHADTLDKHVVAAESDFGARKIWRLDTRFGEASVDKGQAFLRVMRRIGVLPGNNEASGGPDVLFLRQAGVPVVGLMQNGLDYFNFHHTPDDTFDKIDPQEMAQNVAAYAAFIHIASEIEGGFRE